MARQGSKPQGGTFDFDAVLDAEFRAIRDRRAGLGRPGGAEGADPPDLLGVALSGGGIRSASFCLGALQALDAAGLIRKADYLSTVSGGGYIGASMIAAMSRDGGAFPFHFRDPQSHQRRVRDSEPVGHIRDNSNYLAPEGPGDMLRSLAVVLRGIAVNLVLILAVLLVAALPIIAANPTSAHLGHSVLLDIGDRYFPLPQGAEAGWLRGLLADRFIASKALLAVLAAWLLVWAVVRSRAETDRTALARYIYEPASFGARFAKTLALVTLAAFVMELQPVVVSWLIGALDRGGGLSPGMQSLTAAALAVVAATATFREKLVAWIERALASASYGARLRAMLARIAFLAVGLALPLLIWGVFLTILVWSVWIVPETGCTTGCASGYAYAPNLLVADARPGMWVLNLVFALIIAAAVFFKAKASMGLCRALPAMAIAAGLLAFFTAGAHATRAGEEGWAVLANLIFVTLAAIGVGMTFTENANSLNRLYRDRIGAAFRLGRKDAPLPLHDLGNASPYLLVNAALNSRIIKARRPSLKGYAHREGHASDRRSGAAQGLPAEQRKEAGPARLPPPDPARRGRNAEFFLFSRLFVGSDTTGYIPSREMAEAEPELDLATAVAISGAAVSSSMGRIGIGLLGPTLALLNLRLGFWMKNPRFVRRPSRLTRWSDVLRLYLAQEAFGRMSADRPLVYVTDGGHIDNIGLYQLLRRRCRMIVVIDAEADPGYNFGAFCDVQRFIRIDHGVGVTLDWRPLRDAALERAKKPDAPRQKTDPVHARHYAVGRIFYDDGTPDGFLLYVKASVTGDEPDYVLDSERRYPLFPHESTGDQFFSEEQMEAYRALGFHATERALEPDAAKRRAARPGRSAQATTKADATTFARAPDAVDALRHNLESRAPPG